jgi:hypothetical protein
MCTAQSHPGHGFVILRVAGHQRRLLCHLHQLRPHCHLHRRRRAQVCMHGANIRSQRFSFDTSFHWLHALLRSLRTEKLALGNWPGRTKLLGALLCVGGMMVVTLLKGHPLHLWPTGILKASISQAPASPTGGHQHGMVAGTIFFCSPAVSATHSGSSCRYVLTRTKQCSILSFESRSQCHGLIGKNTIHQARVAQIFPARYSLTMLTCLVGSIQSFLVGICDSRTGWKLGWNLQLLTVVYTVSSTVYV